MDGWMDDMGGWMDRMDGCGWTGGWMDQVGLSTSSSRFSKKFHVISQNVAQKLLFVTKVAQKFLENTNTLWGLMLKYVNYTAKIRFLSIFVKFWGVTSVFPQFSSRGRE